MTHKPDTSIHQAITENMKAQTDYIKALQTADDIRMQVFLAETRKILSEEISPARYMLIALVSVLAFLAVVIPTVVVIFIGFLE